jgi:hypothetical protein
MLKAAAAAVRAAACLVAALAAVMVLAPSALAGGGGGWVTCQGAACDLFAEVPASAACQSGPAHAAKVAGSSGPSFDCTIPVSDGGLAGLVIPVCGAQLLNTMLFGILPVILPVAAGPDGELERTGLSEPLGPPDRTVHLRQEAPAVGQEHFARRRQGDPAGGAVEQTAPKRVLTCGYVPYLRASPAILRDVRDADAADQMRAAGSRRACPSRRSVPARRWHEQAQGAGPLNGLLAPATTGWRMCVLTACTDRCSSLVISGAVRLVGR